LKKAQVVDKERRSWHRFEETIERKWRKDYEMETKGSSRKL
jgi:hypothetical protein